MLSPVMGAWLMALLPKDDEAVQRHALAGAYAHHVLAAARRPPA
jgi:hypothetical protein